jgi:hypothetical protein
MDGRDHPANLVPSYYGHSIGWFEGDTLVVDTVGYNEKMWISNREGMPASGQLHTIEKFTRLNFDNIRYDLTIDDPGTYTRTWTTSWLMGFSPDSESFEFSCQDNNFGHELMVGTLGEVDRSDQQSTPPGQEGWRVAPGWLFMGPPPRGCAAPLLSRRG